MNNADRDANVFELVLRTIADIRKETPEYRTMFEGLASIDCMVAKAIEAKGNENTHESFIFILMISGMCHKFLYDLMPDLNITRALMESGSYVDHSKAK